MANTASQSEAPLYWLALGTFSIGTEGFMIAPLLPNLASDLSVSVAVAGQLVTVFALTYAFSSPVLTALTGSLDRRKLLILAMVAFALANLVAWSAQGYWALMGARILLAVAAGLYVPNANALAGALVRPERRGRALAIVNGGTSVAVALGVPLGAIIGDRLGWRMTFASVGALALIASFGLFNGLARNIGSGLATASLRERISVVRRPPVLMALLVTTLWATGAYTVYTYLALFLAAATGIEGPRIGLILFLWGTAAAVGIFHRGHPERPVRRSRRHHPEPSASGTGLRKPINKRGPAVPGAGARACPRGAHHLGPVGLGLLPGAAGKADRIAGLKLAPIVLSLNASFMFIGFSLGAALGSLTLDKASPAALGWVGAACELASLILMIGTTRGDRRLAGAAEPGIAALPPTQPT